MGILTSGLLGGFHKKAGPLIGRRGRGQNIITALYHENTKPATRKQLEVRARFNLLTGFLNNITALINTGFKHYAKNKLPANVAYSYNYKHAFVKDGDEYRLNYPQMVYSRGHIATPEGVQAIPVEGHIRFSWLPQDQSAYCRFTDLATFLIYNSAKDRAVKLLNVTDRYALIHTMQVPDNFAGDTLHCYMSFASADGKLRGDSVYAGAVIL